MKKLGTKILIRLSLNTKCKASVPPLMLWGEVWWGGLLPLAHALTATAIAPRQAGYVVVAVGVLMRPESRISSREASLKKYAEAIFTDAIWIIVKYRIYRKFRQTLHSHHWSVPHWSLHRDFKRKAVLHSPQNFSENLNTASEYVYISNPIPP